MTQVTSRERYLHGLQIDYRIYLTCGRHPLHKRSFLDHMCVTYRVIRESFYKNL